MLDVCDNSLNKKPETPFNSKLFCLFASPQHNIHEQKQIFKPLPQRLKEAA